MKPDHNRQQKVALINDFSGFGRCSISVALPIISTLRLQCCPIPTSIFSNHTGFPSYFFEDYTDRMSAYIQEWKKLDRSFSGLASGFLGSLDQIEIVRQFFLDFRTSDNLILVDPVMGDSGRLYPTYTLSMCHAMKELVAFADILTPNLTEACLLTGHPYHEGKWSLLDIRAMARELSAMGPKKIVITGIPQGDFIANFCYENDGQESIRRTHLVGTQRSGTGDIFAAILIADAIHQVPFQDSVRKASRFIKRCIQRSIELDLPLTDGVCFEEVLHTLK